MSEHIPVHHREQLHYLLAEAAEIEHNLMCCYLYAAWSLKDDTDGDLVPDELAAVNRWRGVIRSVAVEEMTHLALVSNLLTAIGAAPHFGRQNFPVAPGVHPARVVVELAPFDLATLDHFVFLERPEGVELDDGAGFDAPAAYTRGARTARLMPNAHDFGTVGALYAGIREGLVALAARHGEAVLFAGDPAAQVGPELVSLPGLTTVRDLASALAAIDTIVRQGEGTSGDNDRSHFHRFRAMRDEYRALAAATPGFAPARPVARNPVMRRPPTPDRKVWITNPAAEELVDLANAVYTFSLRMLCQGFGWVGDARSKRIMIDGAIDAMFALSSVATALTALPARDGDVSVNAGVTFALLRAIAPLPHGGSEWVFLAERARELTDACAAAESKTVALSAATQTLRRITDSLIDERIRLGRGATSTPAPPADAAPVTQAATAVAAPTAPVPSAEAAPAPTVEEAEGHGVTLRFEGRRCIHARHCVLGAPKVFLANVQGPWLHPEETTADGIAELAHACPSGAITYVRRDGKPDESAPPVNVIRIRENGPLAMHAALAIDGEPPRFRATLCRCGRSKKKPYCDGSHTEGFEATGEPATLDATALAARDGVLTVRPMPDGPLDVQGNMEICAGTGRVVLRGVRARLCRCGGSSKKPLCDGTHARIGFKS